MQKLILLILLIINKMASGPPPTAAPNARVQRAFAHIFGSSFSVEEFARGDAPEFAPSGLEPLDEDLASAAGVDATSVDELTALAGLLAISDGGLPEIPSALMQAEEALVVDEAKAAARVARHEREAEMRGFLQQALGVELANPDSGFPLPIPAGESEPLPMMSAKALLHGLDGMPEAAASRPSPEEQEKEWSAAAAGSRNGSGGEAASSASGGRAASASSSSRSSSRSAAFEAFLRTLPPDVREAARGLRELGLFSAEDEEAVAEAWRGAGADGSPAAAPAAGESGAGAGAAGSSSASPDDAASGPLSSDEAGAIARAMQRGDRPHLPAGAGASPAADDYYRAYLQLLSGTTQSGLASAEARAAAAEAAAAVTGLKRRREGAPAAAAAAAAANAGSGAGAGAGAASISAAAKPASAAEAAGGSVPGSSASSAAAAPGPVSGPLFEVLGVVPLGASAGAPATAAAAAAEAAALAGAGGSGSSGARPSQMPEGDMLKDLD